MSDRPFSIGIEEEYLLVDAETMALAEAPEALLDACAETLGDQVAPEYMRCQIEVGTTVCTDIAEARTDLTRLRRCVAETAARFGLAPIAASCHPSADWTQQLRRDRDRYNALGSDLRGVADRMLVSGMHVHVGIPDRNDRIRLMNQMAYFLPHLLALSASSPFWQGRDTGLASYRIGVFDDLPRTGLPPRLSGWSHFRTIVDTLVAAGIIEDGSKLWWDARPSDSYPTLETRICDITPKIEHTLTLAATIQSTLRMLSRLGARNLEWRRHDLTLLNENRWRARRYGATDGLLDLATGHMKPLGELVEEWITLILEDAEALGCATEVEGLRDIVAEGTSSERQRRVYAAAIEGGADSNDALVAVARSLTEEFLADA